VTGSGTPASLQEIQMTNRTAESSVQHHLNDGQPPGHSALAANRSIRTASLTAGVGLLLISALAGFGNFVALRGLVTEGNAAQTATDIMASNGLFRLGILSLFLTVALDIVVAWALYHVFRPVNNGISMLAAWFRTAYAAVFMVGIGQLIGVLRLLGNDDYLRVFSGDQLHAQALLGFDSFNDIWYASLVLFGLHLLVVGYLAYRSGYVPRFLGVLLGIAGLGYVIDSFGVVLSRGSWTDVSFVTFIGELLFALWLVIWGRRISVGTSRFHDDQVEQGNDRVAG
jgi:hypothetical protein